MERELTPGGRAAARACVFDAYGTLLDLNGAVAPVAARLGDRAQDLLRVWRGKQLEYTWLRSLMGRYADFETVTSEALEYACAVVGADAGDLLTPMMDAFFTLPAYDDAAPLLSALRGAGIRTAVLSNGTPAMLEGGLTAAGLRPLLDEVLSVEAVGIYKPSPAVYQLAIDTFGPAKAGRHDSGPPEGGRHDSIVFVTANSWDAAGAASAGLRVLWINRTGAPVEHLPGRPAAEIATLSAAAEIFGVLPR
jgi:2-haloacid dehalogenase